MSFEEPRYLLGFFTLRFDAPRWSQSHVLEAAARNTAWVGGGVVSFWPSETTYSFAVVLPEQGTWRPAERIAEELGAAVVGDFSVPFDEPVPESVEGWRRATTRHLEAVPAFPWPGGRCDGCGAEQLPHLEGCPFEI